MKSNVGQYFYQNRYSVTANQVTLMMAQKLQNKNDIFLIDSGTSDHVTPELKYLRDVVCIEPQVIVLGDGSTVRASHKGSILVLTPCS